MLVGWFVLELLREVKSTLVYVVCCVLLCVFVRMVVCMDSLLCTQIVHTVVNLPIQAPQCMRRSHMDYLSQRISKYFLCVCTSVLATWCYILLKPCSR